MIYANLCSVQNVPYAEALDDFQSMYDHAMDQAFHASFVYERPVGKTAQVKTGYCSFGVRYIIVIFRVITLNFEIEEPALRAFGEVKKLATRHPKLRIQAPKHFCEF